MEVELLTGCCSHMDVYIGIYIQTCTISHSTFVIVIDLLYDRHNAMCREKSLALKNLIK